ncbi:MAG: helicase-associated domain-containing protein [Corynebacterium sp.]|nr:helicase-associated domain-containing protein [Corynebacterium sp.]
MSASTNSSSRRNSPTTEFRHWLAKLSPSELEVVVRNRPDAGLPVPPDVNAFATRLVLRSSLTLALRACSAQEIAVIEALRDLSADLSAVTLADVAQLVPFPPKPVVAALGRRALIFTQEKDQQTFVALLPQVVQAFPPTVSVLTQTAITPEGINKLPEVHRKALQHIVRSGGQVAIKAALPAAREHTLVADASPSDELDDALIALYHSGYVVKVGPHSLAINRRTLAALNGTELAPIPLIPPHGIAPQSDLGSVQAQTWLDKWSISAAEADSTDLDPQVADNAEKKKVDEAGTAAGLEVVYALDRLIEVLASAPVELLRNKSVGVRAIANLSAQIGRSEEEVKELIALGLDASLLGRGEPEGKDGNFLAPTTKGYIWCEDELWSRWATLLWAWIGSTHTPWSSARAADPEATHSQLPLLRKVILHAFAVASAPMNFSQLKAVIGFQAPLVALYADDGVLHYVNNQAEWLGVTAHGMATRVLLYGPAAAAELCPQPIDQLIIQADMTALAPGPLVPEVHKTLTTFARIESSGLASVYRFDHDSIRAGLDAALTATDMKEFLRTQSWGEIPPALLMLIDDVARTHGTLMSGPAMCYVRSNDELLLKQASATVSDLRLLAPTVAVSLRPLSAVIADLHAAGFSPAAEDEQGASLSVAPKPAVVPPSTGSKSTGSKLSGISSASLSAETVAAIMESLSTSIPGPVSPAAESSQETTNTQLLQQAARGRREVDISYATKDGTVQHAVGIPLTVNAGQVDVHVGSRTVRFPLHRITAVEFTH